VENPAVVEHHYENFPVASWLCPHELRPAVVAIYRFARTADDIADEGNASPLSRRQDLQAYRADLWAAAGGDTESSRWPQVFGPLRSVLREYQLPMRPLTDLLSAFEQDVDKCRYADRAELLDYCARSANPVGRLMLHLYGITDASALHESDAICTALQLANFWQDLSVDHRRGRYYVPEADCASHGVPVPGLWGGADETRVSTVMIDLVRWSRSTMLLGAPLAHRIPGRAGWELRLVVQGGLRILEKVENLRGAIIRIRPTLSISDSPLMLWRALRMRVDPVAPAAESA
jgi:hydroxysqualene synthase